MILYSENTTPEKQKEFNQKIKTIFKEFTLEKNLEFRQLAYKINQNKAGYYYLFQFKADNSMLKSFYDFVKINKNDILRHLLINLDREPLYKSKDQSNKNFEKIAEIQRQYYLKKQQEKENLANSENPESNTQ
ncbi:30S ribosomal protein S6 [Mycoplasma sp. SG1]|nr:30S ribosomal protein S6 [Mycoplasma sp. SG1]